MRERLPELLLHIGELHAYERVVLGVLAFGPFIVLAVVVHLVRKRDISAEPEPEPPDARTDG